MAGHGGNKLRISNSGKWLVAHDPLDGCQRPSDPVSSL